MSLKTQTALPHFRIKLFMAMYFHQHVEVYHTEVSCNQSESKAEINCNEENSLFSCVFEVLTGQQ